MKQKLSANQAGIAHLMLILVAVVLVGVGGAGYFVWNKQKDKDSGNSSLSSSEKKAAEAECKRAFDDKDLCKVASSFDFGNGNYVMTITGEQDGEQISWSVQNDGSNSHSNMMGFETISYNGDTYMKDASGTWVKYPKSEDDEDTTAELTDDLEFKDEEASWYTKVGKEACGNMTCFHYSYKDPNDAENNAELYFDDKDYKIRKITSTSAENGNMEMTITYGNAKVSAPDSYTE